jgi:hypothetical protein
MYNNLHKNSTITFQRKPYAVCIFLWINPYFVEMEPMHTCFHFSENLISNKWIPLVFVPKYITLLWSSSSAMNWNNCRVRHWNTTVALRWVFPDIKSQVELLDFFSFTQNKEDCCGWISPSTVIWCSAFLWIRDTFFLRVAFRTKVKLNRTEQKAILQTNMFFFIKTVNMRFGNVSELNYLVMTLTN